MKDKNFVKRSEAVSCEPEYGVAIEIFNSLLNICRLLLVDIK